MSETMKFPFYIKLAAILLCLIGLFIISYYGQSIISPILLSMLFAIILSPVVIFLNRRLRFPNFLAVIVAIILFLFIFISVVYFISLQVSDMANDWLKIKSNFLYHFEHFQRLIRTNFHLSKREQNEIINKATKDGLSSSNQIVESTLNSFGDLILKTVLIPIYTFLFLLYQNHFITFLSKVIHPKNHKKLQDVLVQIKIAVQGYVVGLLFEMIAVSVLTSIGLYFIGVEYFILLGIITGILNLVPYIGILVAGLLSIMVSLSGSTDISIVLGVVVVTLIVHLTDNNVFVPLFINSKVQINAIVSIVGIIIGNVLGGITGMFLAIPILGVLKVIFDRIDSLEPWGYLFGDDLPKTYEWHKIKLMSYRYQNTTSSIDFTTDVSPTSLTDENKSNDENSIDETAAK